MRPEKGFVCVCGSVNCVLKCIYVEGGDEFSSSSSL